MSVNRATLARVVEEQSLQLTKTEAIQISSVLQSTLDKLALIGSIIIDPKIQAQELTQSVGDEIGGMLDEQKQLQHQFEELIASQRQLRGLPNKTKLRENEAELQRVSEALRQATKHLCRRLKDNPNVTENMAKVVAVRQNLQVVLSACLNTLKLQRTIAPVMEAVLVQQGEERERRETFELEKSTSAVVKQLKVDIKEEKLSHERNIAEKHRAVALLKHKLKEEQLKTAIDSLLQEKALKAGNECVKRLEATHLQDVQHEVHRNCQQIEIERKVNGAMAEFLQKTTARLQDEEISWREKLVEDTTRKDKELEKLRQDHDKALKKLHEVEARLKEELVWKHERNLRVLKEKEAADMEKQANLRRMQAAILIQAWWRGYKVRNAASLSKKKGKKGSKSPKGKKKK